MKEWNIGETNEIAYLIFSFILGALMTAVYDFMRARRREKYVRAVFVYLEDTMWFAAFGVFLYMIAYNQNSGMVRWYSFVGAILGVTVYKLLFRDKVMECFRCLYSLFVMAFCFLVKLIVLPFNLCFSLMKRPVKVVAWHTREGSEFFKNSLKVIAAMLKNRFIIRR